MTTQTRSRTRDAIKKELHMKVNTLILDKGKRMEFMGQVTELKKKQKLLEKEKDQQHIVKNTELASVWNVYEQERKKLLTSYNNARL